METSDDSERVADLSTQDVNLESENTPDVQLVASCSQVLPWSVLCPLRGSLSHGNLPKLLVGDAADVGPGVVESSRSPVAYLNLNERSGWADELLDVADRVGHDGGNGLKNCSSRIRAPTL